MNVNDMLINTVTRYPDVCFYKEGSYVVSYGDFYQTVCRAASFLQAAGAKRQKRVAVIAPNSINYLVILFACQKIGAIPELINWRLSPEKVCSILEVSDAELIFVAGNCKAHVEAFPAGISRPVRAIALDPCQAELPLLKDLMADCSECFEDIDAGDEEVALQIYTSGTTGREKGVMLTNRSVVTKCLLMQRELPQYQGERFLGVLPFFHVALIGLLSTVCSGTTYVAGIPVPELMAKAIEEEKITRITLVPSILNQLVRYLEKNPADVSSLKLINYGAAPMSPELLLKCRGIFNSDYAQGYGMSETMSTSVILLPEHHRSDKYLSTVGKPLLGTHIRIVDEGKLCGTGEIGEILLKDPCLMKGYYKRPELNEQVIRDGWYYTGDIGYQDEEGFLHLVDRVSSKIISGGENIYPKEVEDTVMKYLSDKIAELSVVGVQDPDLGEAVMLAAVPSDTSLTPDEILQVCRAHLDSFKKPRFIYFLDKIPRNEAGKVVRKTLQTYHYDAIKAKGR